MRLRGLRTVHDPRGTMAPVLVQGNLPKPPQSRDIGRATDGRNTSNIESLNKIRPPQNFRALDRASVPTSDRSGSTTQSRRENVGVDRMADEFVISSGSVDITP